MIVRLDAIGDYILFRNFLEDIRLSDTFKKHHITLCGNIAWKDLAEQFDYPFIAQFIWIDRTLFVNNVAYRRKQLTAINKLKIETAICPNNSREFLTSDSLIRAASAKYRMGSVSDSSIDLFPVRLWSKKIYTQTFTFKPFVFEFDKTKKIIADILQQKILRTMPTIDIAETKQQTIVVFPGAGEQKRQWDPDNYASLIQALFATHQQYQIILCGSKGELHIGQHIELTVSSDKLINMTGKTSLADLIRIIGSSALLITNESSALHIAASTKTPVIGLMTGKHFKRFAPYPTHPSFMHLVYPKPLSFYENLYDRLGSAYFENVVSNINEITLKDILPVCNKILAFDSAN